MVTMGPWAVQSEGEVVKDQEVGTTARPLVMAELELEA